MQGHVLVLVADVGRIVKGGGGLRARLRLAYISDVFN